MKHKLMAFLGMLCAVVMALGIFTACGGGNVTPAKAPTAAEAVKSVVLGSEEDVTFTVSWNGSEFVGLKYGEETLETADYAVEGNNVTLRGAFVKELPKGDNAIVLTATGGTCTLTVRVTDPAPVVGAPTVAEAVKTVTLGEETAVVFVVDWHGGAFTEVRSGRTALTAAQASSEGNNVTIAASYIKTLPEGDHAFTLVSTGGECTITVRVNDPRSADPAITPSEKQTVNVLGTLADLAYSVTWGKGTFSQLKEGAEAVPASGYTVEGDTLTLKKEYLATLSVGTHTFTLQTGTGSATFEVEIVSEGSRFDNTQVFKQHTGGDLTFDILISGAQITSVKTEDEDIGSGNYSYDAATKKFALKESYLASLSVGFHTFEIAVSDGKTYTVSTAVKALYADNFENGNTNSTKLTFGNGNSNIGGAEAIEGKSVKMALESPNEAGTFLEGQNFGLTVNKLYILDMLVKIDGKTQLIFTLPGDNFNHAWMNADGTLNFSPTQFHDPRSTSNELSDGVYELKLYLPVTVLEGTPALKVYYRNGDYSAGSVRPQEPTQLIVDNFCLYESGETFAPAQKATLTPDRMMIDEIGDVSVEVALNYGTFESVTDEDGTALTEDKYSFEGTTLTIKAAALAGMQVGETKTFRFNTVDPDKPQTKFSADLTIELTATLWQDELSKNYTDSDVTFSITMKAATVQSIVTEDGLTLEEGDYEYSETALTIKSAWLAAREAKPYEFVMTDSKGASFRFVIYVKCTPETVYYANMEDGIVPDSNSFGIGMNPTLKENGFSGKSATVSGTGTVMFVNRPGFGADLFPNALAYSMTVGETYEFSFRFKIAEGASFGAGGDYGIFGGNNNIFLAIGNASFSPDSDLGKYAYIEEDGAGNLSLHKLRCVQDKTSLTKSDSGVYTLIVTFVAEDVTGKGGGNAIQVPCWKAVTYDIDNILVRKVAGVPVLSGEGAFDKSDPQDVTLTLALHGSTLEAVKLDGEQLTAETDYTVDGTQLTIRKERLAQCEEGTVKITVTADTGESNEVPIVVSTGLPPALTGGDTIEYYPYEALPRLGLDTHNRAIQRIVRGQDDVDSRLYTYESGDKELTFTEDFFKSLVGRTEYTVMFDGGTEIKFYVSSSYDMILDFENSVQEATVGWVGKQIPGLANNTQSIVQDDGSSALKIEAVPEGLVAVYSTVNTLNMDTSYLYEYSAKITVKAGVPIYFRFVENYSDNHPAAGVKDTSRDFFVILANGSVMNVGLNPRSYFQKTDLEDGYVRYLIKAYATPTRANNESSNGNFEIATFASGTGAFDLILDDLTITKTKYPVLLFDFEEGGSWEALMGSGVAISAAEPNPFSLVHGEESISGTTSLRYSSASSGGSIVEFTGRNWRTGFELKIGQRYKLSMKLQMDVSGLQPTHILPIRDGNDGGDIAYIWPDPAADNQKPFFKIPDGTDFVSNRVDIDEAKHIYELSVEFTASQGMRDIQFAVWQACTFVIDDFRIEAIR